MIFHGSVYDEHHMMDWNMGHWIPMILGWGIILLAIFIILYIVIQSTLSAKEKNQMNIQVPKSKKNESEVYDESKYEEENFEEPNFCYSCGKKLDRNNSLKYCPNCGIKI